MQLGLLSQPAKRVVKRVNWEAISRVSVDTIRHDNDVETLESFIGYLRQGRISSKEFPQLKEQQRCTYLSLVQMTIQYMSYTEQYQSSLLKSIQDEEEKILDETQALESKLKQSKPKVQKQKQQVKLERETVSRFRQAVQTKSIFSCYFCRDKLFLSGDLLMQHYKRRHDHELQKPEQQQAEQVLAVQTILLQQQINSMIAAQQQQNQQLLALQQTAYFTALKIEQDDADTQSESESVSEDEDRFNELLEVFRQQQEEREQQYLYKINQLEKAMQNNNTRNSMTDLGQNSRVIQRKQAEDHEMLIKIQRLQEQIEQLQEMKEELVAVPQSSTKLNSYTTPLLKLSTKPKEPTPAQQPYLERLERFQPQPSQELFSESADPTESADPQKPTIHGHETMQNLASPTDDEEEVVEVVEEALSEEKYFTEESQQRYQFQESGDAREQLLANFLHEEKEFFITIKQAKRPKKSNPKAEQYIAKEFSEDLHSHFQELNKVDLKALEYMTAEELEKMFQGLSSVVPAPNVQLLEKLDSPNQTQSPQLQQSGPRGYSIAQEINETQNQSKLKMLKTSSLEQSDMKSQSQQNLDPSPLRPNIFSKKDSRQRKEISFDEFSNSEDFGKSSPIKTELGKKKSPDQASQATQKQPPQQQKQPPLTYQQKQPPSILTQFQPKKQELKNIQFKYERNDSLEELQEDHQGGDVDNDDDDFL